MSCNQCHAHFVVHQYHQSLFAVGGKALLQKFGVSGKMKILALDCRFTDWRGYEYVIVAFFIVFHGAFKRKIGCASAFGGGLSHVHFHFFVKT